MKKQTLEEVALSFLPNSEVEHDTDFIIGFEFGAKWQQEQAKEMEKEQMETTWNNAIDAQLKDKWDSYDDFHKTTFKSE